MFDEIKKKYPKAWEKFVKWYHNNCPYSEVIDYLMGSNDIKSLIGWLLLFFKEQEVYIDIHWNIHCQLMCGTHWEIKVFTKTDFSIGTYTEIGWAIARAFEILEAKEE